MFLKLMSAEDLPDADGSKSYRLIECSDVRFAQKMNLGAGSGFYSAVTYIDARGEQQHLYLEGNAYLLNNAGKTIESFWPRHLERLNRPVTADGTA